jgi:hypothetical protein
MGPNRMTLSQTGEIYLEALASFLMAFLQVLSTLASDVFRRDKFSSPAHVPYLHGHKTMILDIRLIDDERQVSAISQMSGSGASGASSASDPDFAASTDL